MEKDNMIPEPSEQEQACGEASASATLDSEASHGKDDSISADLSEPSLPKSAPAAVLGGTIAFRAVHLIWISILLVALVGGGVILGLHLGGRDVIDPDIDPNAHAYGGLTATPNEGAGDQITLPGYTEVIFPANTQQVQLILPNPTGNICYFRFTLVLADTGEELYHTGLIPPGQAVTDLTLSRALEKGRYTLEIRIECFSLVDKSPMNGGVLMPILTVQ